jgi:hypothetical protein
MNFATFHRIAAESDFTEREVTALARLLAGANITKSEVEAVESFLVKQQLVLREIHASELLQRGRERFGEPKAWVATAIKENLDLERLEDLLNRVHDYERWEELLLSSALVPGNDADR